MLFVSLSGLRIFPTISGPRICVSTRYALSDSRWLGRARDASKIENLKLSAMELNRGNDAYARITSAV
jgi:hypothetical protein